MPAIMPELGPRRNTPPCRRFDRIRQRREAVRGIAHARPGGAAANRTVGQAPTDNLPAFG